MTYLLDVNVLIALLDPAHVHHGLAHAWFARHRAAWATCPLTENGVVRIVGNPRYPNSPGGPPVVAKVVRQFRDIAGHVFWPDDISLLDSALVDTAAIRHSGEVTDVYLLSLAAAHGGRLATLDGRLSTLATVSGRKTLCLIS